MMGLAHRIIPVILCSGRQMVKGKQFNSWRTVGMAAQAVRIHQMRGVDEIVLLDINATKENRGPDLQLIESLADVVYCPLSVGGGVRNLTDAKALLKAGADKVVIRSGGLNAIRQCAFTLGSQAVVAAIDVTSMDDMTKPSSPRLCRFAQERALAIQEAGAGEILLTRCELEGMLCGYDLGLVSAVAAAVDIPVVAHGGAGHYQHMLDAIRAGADAVAAGAMFQFTDQTPKGAAEFLHAAGIEVRL